MGGGAISFFNTKTEKLNIAVLLCMLCCCVAVLSIFFAFKVKKMKTEN